MLRPATLVTTLFALAGALLVMSLPVRADAQSTVENSAYEAALDRALTAHAKGDLELAESAMREAHQLAPSARTLRGLGVILYAQGRYLAAVESLELALASADRPLVGDLRAGAVELLARLFQRISRVRLRIEPSDSVLRIDDAEPVLNLDGEVYLMPADHHIHIEAPGHEPYALSLRTSPGARDSLHVVLAVTKPAVAAAASQVSATATAARGQGADGNDERSAWWTSRRRRALLGTGVGLAVAGGTTWLVGYLRFQNLDDACADMAGGGCTDAEAKRGFEREHIEALTLTGATLAGTGVAVLALALGLELWQRGEQKSARILLSAGPGVGLSGQF